jgi:hypothetical protein
MKTFAAQLLVASSIQYFRFGPFAANDLLQGVWLSAAAAALPSVVPLYGVRVRASANEPSLDLAGFLSSDELAARVPGIVLDDALDLPVGVQSFLACSLWFERYTWLIVEVTERSGLGGISVVLSLDVGRVAMPVG